MGDQDILADISLQRGGLVEIYVIGTSLPDWTRMMSEFADAGYISQFTEAGKVVDLTRATALFESASGSTRTMSLDIDGQAWTTSFLSEDNIDLQADPDDIKTVDDLQKVARLMGELHRITGKRVLFVPETLNVDDVSPYLSIG